MSEQGPDGNVAAPYAPSWVDRFTEWLDSLPGPALLAYLSLYLLIVAQAHVMFWILGRIPAGEISIDQFVYNLFSFEVLFFFHYLDRDARRALADFRPMMDISDDQFDRIEYRLTTLPAVPVRVLTVLGIAVGGYYSYTVDRMVLGETRIWFGTFYGAFGFAISMTLALVFCYRMIVQLRMVSKLYDSAENLDLFNLNPVYAISTHTAKTGLIFLVLVYSNLLWEPGSINIPTALLTTVIVSILSLAVFLLPLQGVNRKLAVQKSERLKEINARIKEAFKRLELDFDRDHLDGMHMLEKTIANLERQRVFIEAIPTWPWKPATLRGFVSAMVLPIVIWLVQQVLDRVLVF